MTSERRVDVLHLSFKPPFTAGSYNRFLGAFVRRPSGLSQGMVSFWEGPRPAEDPWGERLVLVDGKRLSLARRIERRLPERWRGLRTNGISGRDTIAYAWGAADAVRRLRPRVVVCYDGTKLGGWLRSAVDGPCRLVLAQRGFTYDLDPRAADRLYSLSSFDVVWTMTRASYRHDRARGGLYEPTVDVLANAVDTETFRPPASGEEKARHREEWRLPPERPVVLLLARLVPKKGAHVLVEAWDALRARVPGALLWLVGDGDEAFAARLRRTAAALGVEDSVRFEGAVPFERVPGCFRAADLFAFPTLCGEGQARTLLEAMATGLPCVVSDHPAVRELYRGEEVHLVEDPNLRGRFVEAIAGVLADPSRSERLGAAARRAVVGRFSETDRFAELESFLERQVRLAGPPVGAPP